jgi:hypothetical protein
MGLIETGGSVLRLTEAGLAVSDTVVAELAVSLTSPAGICA